MDDRESASAIDAAAARWAARLDGRTGDPQLQGELDRWIDADDRRRGALLRARAAWHVAGTAEAEGRDDEADVKTLPRRGFLVAGIAMLVAVGSAGAFLASADERFETQIGEQRDVALRDGSRITLNTRSSVRANFTADGREIELREGEAFFAVKRDPARPFVIRAGGVRVEAIGTAFSVRRRAGRVDVAVAEGKVRTWAERAPARFLMLTAGERASIDETAGVASQAEAGADAALAWRQGQIVLDGMTLGDAAAEFNRYNRRKLSIEAPLATRRAVGWFRTDDVEGFAKSAAILSGGRVDGDDAVIRIVR